jgi:broad specificity phosphatase PhoE
VSDRLLLIRHGLTDWNREGRFQGHLDPPLSDVGRAQAALLAARLAASEAHRPRSIVSSPLRRALETAEAIGAAVGLASVGVTRDARLIELGQGAWEGHTHAELATTDADRYAAWQGAAWDRHPPEGEPVDDAAVRVQASLISAIAASDAGGAWPLCLVGHGGSLRLAAGWLLDLEPARAWALELDNASLSVVDRSEDGWKLITWNDIGHLLGRGVEPAAEADGKPLAL